MMKSFNKITVLSEKQIIELHQLYQNEWWSKNRTLEEVRKMLTYTDLIFGICEQNTQRLIAFARVLSDQVYKALILDVIVAEDFRKLGLGRELMEMILNHQS